MGRLKAKALFFAVNVTDFGAGVAAAAAAAAAQQAAGTTAAVAATVMFGVICASIYDAKPFNMMTSALGVLSRTTKQRKVWDPSTSGFVWKSFLRWNIQDLYNNFMDGVDLQDQLRWYYRLDGKRMWRSQKWTWAVFLFVINTRAVNAWLMHKMLVEAAAKKWDEAVVELTRKLRRRPPRRTRRPWEQPTLEAATRMAKEEVSHSDHATIGYPRPKPLSHLEFRLAIVRGLLGMSVSRFGKRRRGRPSAAATGAVGAASAASVAAGQAAAGSPERNKKMKAAAANSFSTAKKGSAAAGTHQYPRLRAAAGQRGLNPLRLVSGELATHRPWPMNAQRKNWAEPEKNRHRCQVCAAVGTIWKDGNGAAAFRGGVKEPRRAQIMCTGANCPASYCSLECYNWFHVGHEYFEGPAPGGTLGEDDMMDVE